MRMRSRVLVAAVASASLLAAVQFLSTSASAQGGSATERVIVIYKNQDSAQPATRKLLPKRESSFHGTQAPVVSQLSASGARSIHSYKVIDATSATVPANEVAKLKTNPAVSQVVPDQIIHLAPAGTSAGTAGGSAASGANVCAAPGKVQLDPQALQAIHADSEQSGAQTARSLGFNGSGVTVGFIADGLDISNPDFIRANGKPVFVDYKDFSGEGTGVPTGGEEAFGDASSIAAQGREVYNVANFGPHAVKTPCDIRVEGVAPGAGLVGLDVFGAGDAGFNSSILNAIDYAVSTDHVNVLNESFGNNYYPDDSASLDLIKRANDDAVAAGTTVTVSSGDAGVTSTIGTPSTDRNVISAGATTTYRIDLQTGYGGAQFPGVRGYLSNDVGSVSSGGFEQDGRTVDIVAPGELNWALCSTNTAMYLDCVNYYGKGTPVLPFGGTSESAPLTAGVAALVIQAYAKTHGTDPTPQQVKQIIASTSDDIDSPAEQQGAGEIDAYKAVLAAESYKAPASTPKPAGSTLLKSATRLNAVDQPGTPETLTDTITNNGASTQRVSVSSRALGAYQSVKTGTVSLSDASSPKTTDWQGVPDSYEPITFRVPAGEDRLNASIAFQNALSDYDLDYLNARVRLTLVDPSGDLAAYSVPQGDGNYGNVQVTNPKPGTWTAYVWSRVSSQGGSTGPVLFGASVARYGTFGSVSPRRLTLAPGQSAPVQLTVSTPSSPGDSAGSIVFSGNQGPSFGRQSTIPVTLRSVVPSGRQAFEETLTGGNGRAPFTGQTFYYQLDVPGGSPELNAAIKLADNPNNPFSAFLVSPAGEAVGFAGNELQSGNTATNVMGAQLHVLSPAQGTWTLIVLFAPQVSGTTLTEPFQVSTNESAVPASAQGLPDSSTVTLAAGTPQTYDVRIRNNGPAPEAYFLDARLPQSVPLTLAAQNSPDTTVPLSINNNIPAYLIPTGTTAFTETASTTGSTPIEFDSTSAAGDPDIGSTVGSSVVGSLTGNPIAQGAWNIVPDVVGAYGATGAPTEPVTTAETATSQAFDGTVSSPTGDLWLGSTNPAALQSLSPTITGPGQTATIPVRVTPKGPSGAKVSGTLYVDDTSNVLFGSLLSPNGDQIAAIPYSYTVK